MDSAFCPTSFEPPQHCQTAARLQLPAAWTGDGAAKPHLARSIRTTSSTCSVSSHKKSSTDNSSSDDAEEQFRQARVDAWLWPVDGAGPRLQQTSAVPSLKKSWADYSSESEESDEHKHTLESPHHELDISVESEDSAHHLLPINRLDSPGTPSVVFAQCLSFNSQLSVASASLTTSSQSYQGKVYAEVQSDNGGESCQSDSTGHSVSAASIRGRGRGRGRGNGARAYSANDKSGNVNAADGDSISGDGDGSSTTATEADQNFVEAWSVGGEHHAEGKCKPCIFYRKPVGCGNGEDCQFCHFYHQRPPRHRRHLQWARRQEQAANEDIASATRILKNFLAPTSLREYPAEGLCEVGPPSESSVVDGKIGSTTQHADGGDDDEEPPELRDNLVIWSALQPYDSAGWGEEDDIPRTPSLDWETRAESERMPRTPSPDWDRVR